MQIVAIHSGNFSDKGNFSGYNASGQRVHIAGRQMEALGHTPESVKTKPISFPLYTIAVEREFNVLDANGEPTTEKFTRTQAGSVFATKQDAITAYNSDKVLGLEATADLAKVATGLGLTEELLKDLASVAV
jgi:hypothetical protein